jgi:YidC/Oxa1 family membrane protein insertase
MFIANVLQPLIDACQWVLEFWHGVIGNGPNSWGWAIILLTFTVRILILPLTFKGVKGMQRLQTLQPEIKKIQERYKDDKQRMNQEVMAFYQREKVNPLSSCMPLLLQIPFFISLFYLLRSNAFKEDIAANPGFYPIDNLAEKITGDPVLLGALIVLYVGTQLAASAVTAFSADPMQRRIMFALPFVFVIFIINFQAGLIVYWITTNVWTIGQQLLVKKLYPKPVLDAEAQADEAVSTPARGKPPSTVVAASDGGDGETKPKEEAKSKDGKAGRKPAAAPAAGGGARTKAPPASPRKKKKRSGRRR